MEIEGIALYKIQNSRAEATVAARINGETASAPSGASAGTHEAASFVPERLERIEEELQEKFIGGEFSQKEFDRELEKIDGSAGFENIGSVGIACSLAFKKAKGYSEGRKFPYPLGNVVGGGEHGGNTDIQEFLVLPADAESFPKAVETNAKILHEMEERYSTKIKGKNDEGALITSMNDEKTLESLKKVAKEHNAEIGMDIAASELWNGKKYVYSRNGMELSPKRQLKKIKRLAEKYGLYYIEDSFHEEDFESHRKLGMETEAMVTGDDLFVTSPERLERGIETSSCSSIIIKPNQAGTVSKTKRAVDLALEAGYTPVISHRSGETCDVSISDMALEWNIPVIKAGITDIRTAKLNRLIVKWQDMEKNGEEPVMAEL
ncbi:MAG: enolase C-terminal domain-like protein [Candidatus Nanohaloarchaea archaeon]|nr:enolase C-terminal domain-like protein [Candidatus Nanohaloarchaea archaeon]